MTMCPLPQINGLFNFQTSFKFYSAPSFFLTLHWETTTLQTFLYQAGPSLNLCFGKQSPCWVLVQETLIMIWKFDLKSEKILKEPHIRPTVLSLYTWTITMWFKHFARQCGTGLHRWGMSYKASWKSKEVCKQYPLNKQEANVFREHHRSNMAVCSDVQLWPCSMTTCKA